MKEGDYRVVSRKPEFIEQEEIMTQAYGRDGRPIFSERKGGSIELNKSKWQN
jgi:hypothetical protein